MVSTFLFKGYHHIYHLPFKGYLPIWYLLVLNSPVKIDNQIPILGINFEGRKLGLIGISPLWDIYYLHTPWPNGFQGVSNPSPLIPPLQKVNFSLKGGTRASTLSTIHSSALRRVHKRTNLHAFLLWDVPHAHALLDILVAFYQNLLSKVESDYYF